MVVTLAAPLPLVPSPPSLSPMPFPAFPPIPQLQTGSGSGAQLSLMELEDVPIDNYAPPRPDDVWFENGYPSRTFHLAARLACLIFTVHPRFASVVRGSPFLRPETSAGQM